MIDFEARCGPSQGGSIRVVVGIPFHLSITLASRSLAVYRPTQHLAHHHPHTPFSLSIYASLLT